MVTRIRQWVKHQRQRLTSSTGQIAVILIFVAAIGLIFYAIAMNWDRVSQVKVLTTVAANQAASYLASTMASYGQYFVEVQLGGSDEVCGWTGIFLAILTIIAIVISLLFPPAGMTMMQLYFALAVAVVNLVLQVAVVQPGITDAWNSIKNELMPTQRDKFIESGIQVALMGAVTDQKKVPDVIDSDQDRIFGFDAENQPLDEVGRFSYYYTRRLNSIVFSAVSSGLTAFLDGLDEFVYERTDGWGLFDPVVSCGGSECNLCCLPLYQTDENGIVLDSDETQSGVQPNTIRPTCCDSGGGDQCGSVATCYEKSPYQEDPSPPPLDSNFPSVIDPLYAWVYDIFGEQAGNSFFSFREQIGRDDEHRDFTKDPLLPNGVQNPDVRKQFVLEDSEGFYPTDYKKSVFPFFYKVADWEVNLNAIDTINPEECHWCTADEMGFGGCSPPAEIPQLVLSGGSYTYENSLCVDGTNNNRRLQPPVASDKVVLPDNILAKDTLPLKSPPDTPECAQDAFKDPSDTTKGFWKRGGDRFCSKVFPYNEDCEKHKNTSGEFCTSANGTTVNCTCAESGQPELWPDDVIDDLVYGLPDFIVLAIMLLKQDPESLSASLDQWYEDWAPWIEKSPPDTPEDCYVCSGTQGFLWEWLNDLNEMIARLRAFRDTSYAGSNCEAFVEKDPNAVWCVPMAQAGTNAYGINECPGVTADYTEAGVDYTGEVSTFDVNNNGIRGDLEDVVACLTWNIEDTSPAGAVGNAAKFQDCVDMCNASGGDPTTIAQNISRCDHLPRSLVPTREIVNLPNGGPTPFSSDIPRDQGWVDEAAACLAAGTCATDSVISANLTYMCDPAPGEWLDYIGQSAHEAQRQVEKFTKRRDFLKGRLAELDYMIAPALPEADLTALKNCRDACSNPLCQPMPPAYFTDIGDPAATDFEGDGLCDLAVWPTTDWYQRIDETINGQGVFSVGSQKFEAFLTCADNDGDGSPDGPACQLIHARRDYDNAPKTGLPYQAIYAWQGEPPLGRAQGYWHIVKVDARIPGKCDNACNTSGTDRQPWPRVKTRNTSWGLKRCYYLVHKEGMVKVRVTRFDEERDPALLMFPNGTPIWDFRMLHPARRNIVEDVSTLFVTCQSQMATDPVPDNWFSPTYEYDFYGGAFMLNELTVDNQQCWNKVHNLLAKGVTTETCAQYYYHGGSRPGMGIKFVPCPDF